MNKSSLLEIIRTFTPKELIRFEDFVNSPYFNKNMNVTNLFAEIKKYAPEFNHENLEKEKVWKKIFPGKEYNYGIMKNLIFDLNKLAEQFLSELTYSKDKFKQTEYLMNAFFERELKKAYNNNYRSFSPKPDLKVIEENNLQISDHINHVHRMYLLNFSYQHQYDQNYKIEDLQIRRDSSLITGFMIQLFAAFNNIAAFNNFQKSDLVINPVTKFINAISPEIGSIIESLKDSSELNSTYLSVYYSMYRAITECSEEQYLRFKEIVFRNINVFPKSNLQELHFNIINVLYVLKLENLNGHKEVIEILDSLVQQNALEDVKNQKIPLHVFDTYVKNCFALKDTEKLKTFAERFICKLKPELRDNTTNHVKFMISFIDKNFEEALRHLSLLDIPFVTFKISLRCHKAMCQYETNNHEMFRNEFDNLKHFINNNKNLAEKFKVQLNTFYSHTKQLFDLRENFDEYEFLKLEKNIYDTYKKSIYWFNEKLEEIQKENS
ncbi:MAG: hypothetical protein ABI528_04620 [bacterium]